MMKNSKLAGFLVACLLAFSLNGCIFLFRPKIGSETYITVSLRDGPPLKAAVYRPSNWTPDAPVIFALHGVNRNVPFTLRTWMPLADRYGFMLIVPRFDTRHFPGSLTYAQGDLMVQGKLHYPNSFDLIDMAFAEVRQRYGVRRAGYRLFGHSAGAQFLHRFLIMKPDAPVERAVVSMAGWYTLPDDELDWPYGLKGTGQTVEGLRKPLATKVVIQVGREDNKRNDAQLRRTSAADAQGNNRFVRGRNYYFRMRDIASEYNFPFHWKLEIVNNAGHESDKGAQAAIAWLASDSPPIDKSTSLAPRMHLAAPTMIHARQKVR